MVGDPRSQPVSSQVRRAADETPMLYGLVAVSMLGLVILASLLSVNVFPAITNDSVVYIEHSRDLLGGGLVVDGFRQVGYPAFLGAIRGIADFVGAEPLLATAVVQRLLLVLAGVLAFRAWRWWSLPLLVFLFAPATIAYTNFLLTEALAFSLAVLLVLPTVAYLRAIRDQPHETLSRRLLLWGGLATLGALYLFTVRFTFAVFGAIPLVLAMAGWKSRHRKLGLGLLASYVLLAGTFTLALALENRGELGVATPSATGDHAEYYYAWLQVFREEPENRTDPELAEYYDDGVVYDFERQLTADDVPYRERNDQFEDEISAMLSAAGVSEQLSKVESMAWSLLGGRIHDVAGGLHGIVHSTSSDVDESIYLNSLALQNGPQAFADRYNDGRRPQAIITDPLGVRFPVPDGQSLTMLLVPLSVTTMIIGLRYTDSRWTATTGILVVLATAIGMGWIRADNFRFLLVSSAFAIAVATSLLPQLWPRWREKTATVPITVVAS